MGFRGSGGRERQKLPGVSSGCGERDSWPSVHTLRDTLPDLDTRCVGGDARSLPYMPRRSFCPHCVPQRSRSCAYSDGMKSKSPFFL